MPPAPLGWYSVISHCVQRQAYNTLFNEVSPLSLKHLLQGTTTGPTIIVGTAVATLDTKTILNSESFGSLKILKH